MALRRAEAAVLPTRRDGFGIIRVSKLGKRSKEKIVSPREQQERIAFEAARENINILQYFSEIDVSGRKPLEKRPGLKEAVTRIEHGEGQVLVAAYFDRLVRNTAVKREIVERCEAATGTSQSVLAVDFGYITEKTATHWVTGEIMAVLSEFYARQTGEKTRAARIDALDRGIVTFPNVPLGYLKVDKRLVVDAASGPLIADCFRMRVGGATVEQIRGFLREHGIERTYRQVRTMFELELYLGHMRDGELLSENTHPPLVDPATFRLAQKVNVPRGRKPRELRLLNKLGLVVCGGCHRPLYAGFKTKGDKHWEVYRCKTHFECPSQVSISAVQLEAEVLDQLEQRIEEQKIRPGQAGQGELVAEAQASYERAQRELDEAVEDLKGIRSTNRRQVLLDHQTAVDDAALHLQKVLTAAGPLELLRGDKELRELDLEDQRALLRDAYSRIRVLPAIINGKRLATRDRVKSEFA